jgi:hypothetical protein
VAARARYGGVRPDPYTYPAFDAPLRAAIRREMELFLDSVFRTTAA